MIRVFTFFIAMLLWSLPLAAQTQATGQDDSGIPRAVFEVDALNPRLGSFPDDLNRRTPQATVEALLDRAAQNDPAAAHLLHLPEDTGPDRGAELALQLARVIERAVTIDWRKLTDRPDALLDTSAPKHPLSGEARRSVILGQVDMPGGPTSIRLNRLEPPDRPAVWLFSRETVGHIPALHERHGPGRLEQALPDTLRKDTVFGLMRWELFALPLAIVMIGALTWAVWRFMDWLAGRRRLGARLARAARAPLALLTAGALSLWMIGDFFVFSSEVSYIATPLSTVVLALAVLLFLLRAFDVVMERLVTFDEATLQDAGQDQRRVVATRVSALRGMLIMAILVIAGLVALHELQLASGLGLSLLASASLLTLVFGFAARKMLANIVSAMQIQLNHSARVGDKVKFRDYLCHVERIHFTFVQLRVWTGIRLIVPISDFVSEPFENWTIQERAMLRLIRLRLAHDADVRALRQDFETILDGLDPEQIDDRTEAFVMVTDQDLFGKEVTFALPCANPDTAWQLSCEAREALVDAANRHEAEGVRMLADVRPTEAA